MSRKGTIKRREIEPDPIYKSRLVTKLINRATRSGKKSAAAREIYHSFDLIKEQAKEEPMSIFVQAIENIKPQMEVRSRRIGGAAYQVPMPVRGSRKESLAIRWLLQSAAGRANREYHHFAEKLAAEIFDAYKNEGNAVKKRENIHKMAEANKAFAHFRW